MIDLYDNKKLVFSLMFKAGIPNSLSEEVFQDFAVYFYTYYYYEDVVQPSTYIHMVFGNYLSERADRHKTKDAILNKATEINSKREDWLDWIQSEGELGNTAPELEMITFCEEVFSKFKPLTQGFILEKAGGESGGGRGGWGNGYIRKASGEQGVSRQAIEKRIKNDIKKVMDSLGE